MARLAAYYQEDFHYAPVGYGPKQSKTAYVVYEEPKSNLFHSSYVNGGPRIRALASSDPTLSPKIGSMTLKAKPFNNNQLVEQSRHAIQRLEDMYDSVGPYAVTQLDPEACDCESVYSHGGREMYDDTYIAHKHKSKDKMCKRLSYNEAWDSGHFAPEMCVPRNMDRYQGPHSLQVRSFDTVHGESFPVDSPYIDHCENGFVPPVSYRSDSSHGRWQQWPWNMPDTRINPVLLSPPSPLDSGLSSQSITSSPSLEGEPIHVHPGQMQAIRPDIRHVCSCSPHVYTESGHVISSPGRYDSGRSSPGAYSLTSRGKKASVRVKNAKNLNNGIVYVENDFEDDYPRSQVRYGMLGLVGEPVDSASTIPKVPNGNYHNMNQNQNNNGHAAYYYIEEDATPLKRSGHRSSKSHKSQSSCTRPTVIITEAPEKNSSNPNTSSPEQDISDKSLEPASTMSTATSPSNSSSLTSSNDAENEERRKAKKKTEKEIRELEDMYKKCNLGDDIELLERAERRDLQAKLDQCARSLTRSKSDTCFEMASPKHGTPHRGSYRASYRRAGIPDIIADDMALRKLRRPVTTATLNPVENTITYMLCSSHFTPTVSGGKDILYMDSPDVEYDDLSYRKHYFGKKSKIQDPQPPFGIPLKPPPPQNVYNDYLHAVPMGGPQPICHPRGNPDVVRDDMAYRTLRKDEPERIYYDAAEVYKKKRG